jgi:hypothetical protein
MILTGFYIFIIFKEHIRAIEQKVLNPVIFYINVVTFFNYHHKIIFNILCLEEAKL